MAYSLTTHFAGQGLLDSFSFFTGDDPSNGFVDYQSRDSALAQNLVGIDELNRVRLGVDSTNTYSTSDKGRPSVRLTSYDGFTYGLFIADIAHMPASQCGTWPAFWAFNNADNGEDWPAGGELDIIEGANTAQRNLISAHTSVGCEAPNTGFTGDQGATNCGPSLENIGCNYAAPTTDTSSYGDAFNAEGGGVYALEWDSEDLKLWHFPRSAIPDDIRLAPVVTPDPSSWGPPQAIFGGSGCDADNYFYNMSLVINTNFCGDYAGRVWGNADQCNILAPTCKEFVAANPGSFKSAFWNINYIDIYQKAGNLTIPPNFPNRTSSVTNPISSATQVPVSANISASNTEMSTTMVPGTNATVTPSNTRTITLTTVTAVISTAEPTQTGGGLNDPATINGYTLLGCFGSSAGYQSFTQIASFATMDNEACVASCAGRKYAGVYGETCYCADILGDASAVDNDMCDTPCPGNPLEFCGGVLDPAEVAGIGMGGGSASVGIGMATNSSFLANFTLGGNSTSGTLARRARLPSLYRRAAPSNILLTVYGDVGAEPVPPGAPAMGGGSSDDPVMATTSAIPSTVTTAITVTYTTVCSTNPALLVEAEYCTMVTYEDCGCTQMAEAPSSSFNPTAMTTTMAQPSPIIAAVPSEVPMTTCTETCDACGPRGESTVTLTVPLAVASAAAATATKEVVVQTVIPVVVGAAVNATRNGTTITPVAAQDMVPVAAAAAAVRVGTVVGWGVGLWLGLFGVFLAL
ncbi:glycoside hydrolase family 16 protein [Xylariomycetidae sp. FL2044]|nr:glycoside hydrolase family 16 protein [Xylariomycetidae sp. FL2044]